MQNNIEKLLNKIIFWGIYLTMLLPFVISPFLLLPDKFAKVVIFRIIVGIILIPFIFLVLYKKEYRPRFNALTIAVVSFWVVGLFATIFSMQPFTSIWGSATRGSGFFNFTHYVIFFFILAGVARTKEQWKKIFNFAIVVAVLVSIFALLQKIVPAFNPEFMNSSVERPSGTMGNPIMLANYLVMLIFITFAFWRQEIIDNKKRMFYFFSGLLILGAIFATQTRGALLGLMSGATFFLLLYPFKNAKFTVRKRILVLFGILIVILLLFIFNSTLHVIPKRIFTLGSINRLTSWQIATEAIKDKPLLGWGPGNFAIPFDKYYPGGYTTSYNNLAETWWDKAHNVPLDIGVNMGLLGLVAYLGIFGTLFWKLRSIKDDSDNQLFIYALMATFLAYFVQNLTSFDSVVSYILFFTLLAWVIFTTNHTSVSPPEADPPKAEIRGLKSVSKNIIGAIASIVVVFIIIKVSILPFWLNYKTNLMTIPAREGRYRETIEPYRAIVNKYQGKTYYEKELNDKFMKVVGHFAPAILHQIKDIEEYKKINQEAINILKRSVELEPYHTKHYYNIGLFSNNTGTIDMDATGEAWKYFTKALELSPNREQILIEMAKSYIVLMDYDSAIENLQKVTVINPRLSDAYFWLGIVNLYKQNITIGKKYLEFAEEFGYDTEEIITLKMLAGVYSDIHRWEDSISYYLRILEQEPDDTGTRALLAGSYKKIGKIKEAREQAEILLQTSPEARESIEAFLKSL